MTIRVPARHSNRVYWYILSYTTEFYSLFSLWIITLTWSAGLHWRASCRMFRRPTTDTMKLDVWKGAPHIRVESCLEYIYFIAYIREVRHYPPSMEVMILVFATDTIKTLNNLLGVWASWSSTCGCPVGAISPQLSTGHFSSVLFPAISWGGGNFPPPPESQIPPQKNTQNTKNIKKCIEFTPQICVSPPEPGV